MNESAIEKAAEAMYAAQVEHMTQEFRENDHYVLRLPWQECPGSNRELYRSMARAAYPHLSVWEEPAPEEMADIWKAVHLGPGTGYSLAKAAIKEWIRRNRNAPPVDPRMTAILRILDGDLGTITKAAEDMAKRILAAIDEVKGKG